MFDQVELFASNLFSDLARTDGTTASMTTVFLSLALAYVGGLAASLTPCVYPMIPITISVIGGSQNIQLRFGQSASSGKMERHVWIALLLRSIFYVLGIATVYSLLGVIAGLSGQVFGTITQNRSGYIVLACVFTFASLMMLDVIRFDPQLLLNRIKGSFSNKKSAIKVPETHETSFFSSYLLGATSALIASPCTTPVLTAILAYIAKTQSVGLGFLFMFSFALGMSTLLLIIALFAGAVKYMPRSGMWLEHIKKLSGFILLVFSNYLFFKAGGTQ